MLTNDVNSNDDEAVKRPKGFLWRLRDCNLGHTELTEIQSVFQWVGSAGLYRQKPQGYITYFGRIMIGASRV